MSGPETNPLAMSDEEFGQLSSPPEVTPQVEDTDKKPDPEVETGKVDDEDKDKQPDDEPAKQEDDDEPEKVEQEGDDPENKDKKADDEDAGKSPEKGDKLPAKDKSGDEDKGKKEPELDADGNPVEKEPEPKPVDFESFYKEIMAPLKANGKMIEIKTPDEAKQLMRMGANYTRKMQAIAPHRKVLMMLENNGLLDEGKLSLLIDINKKDPEAIKKFFKDSGIDPLDVDTKQDSTYREGNHRVTDAEVRFRTTLDELVSIPEGRETLKQIDTQWDQASKEILWEQPDVMELIHQQRENGIYDIITTELERQRALGAIPANVPYLHAYKTIGDNLTAAGAFNHLAEKKDPPPEKKPAASHVATRIAAPKKDTNGDKANAAATSRNAGKKADTIVNPLALSDEEFMKQVDQFQGRV